MIARIAAPITLVVGFSSARISSSTFAFRILVSVTLLTTTFTAATTNASNEVGTDSYAIVARDMHAWISVAISALAVRSVVTQKKSVCRDAEQNLLS